MKCVQESVRYLSRLSSIYCCQSRTRSMKWNLIIRNLLSQEKSAVYLLFWFVRKLHWNWFQEKKTFLSTFRCYAIIERSPFTNESILIFMDLYKLRNILFEKLFPAWFYVFFLLRAFYSQHSSNIFRYTNSEISWIKLNLKSDGNNRFSFFNSTEFRVLFPPYWESNDDICILTLL